MWGQEDTKLYSGFWIFTIINLIFLLSQFKLDFDQILYKWYDGKRLQSYGA